MRKISFLTLLFLIICSLTHTDVFAAETINSMNTRRSEETPCQINVKAILPENFFENASVTIQSVDTGQYYSFILLNVNGYIDRCYVPEGEYKVVAANIYNDTKGKYTFEPVEDFTATADTTTDIEVMLENYAETDAEIKAKLNSTDERIKKAEAEYYEKKVAETEEIIITEPVEEKKTSSDTESPYEIVYSENVPDELGFSVSGSPNAEYNMVVRITKAGPLSVCELQYATDRVKFSESIVIPLSGKVELGDTGITVIFTAPQGMELPEGIDFRFYCPDPLESVVITYGDDNSSNTTVSAETIDENSHLFDVLYDNNISLFVQVDKGGKPSEAVIRYSFDGGTTLSDQIYMPQDGVMTFEELGVRLVFSSKIKELYLSEGDTFLITAEKKEPPREKQPMRFLFILGVIVAIGYYGFTSYIKSMKPKAVQYKINEYVPFDERKKEE